MVSAPHKTILDNGPPIYVPFPNQLCNVQIRQIRDLVQNEKCNLDRCGIFHWSVNLTKVIADPELGEQM